MKRTELQPFIFGFIVSFMCSGGFVYLCHIYANSWVLAILAICMVVSVIISIALGLSIFSVIKANKKAKV